VAKRQSALGGVAKEEGALIMDNTEKSLRKIRAVFFCCSSMVFLFCALMAFLPEMQEAFISFYEKNILERTLRNVQKWRNFLTYVGCLGMTISGLLALCLILDKNLKICRFLHHGLTVDMALACKNLLARIPPYASMSFLIILIGCNIVYGFHTINYQWGNHEWQTLLYPCGLVGTLATGRYFDSLIHFFLFSGWRFLPVISNLFGFFFYSLAAVMLCAYWKIPKHTGLYAITGLTFVTQPYLLNWLFFASGLCTHVTAPFFILAAFFVCEKIPKQNRIRGWLYFVLGAFLFWFAIGTYPVTIATIAVIFLGRFLVCFLESEDLLKTFIKRLPPVCSIVAAVLLHLVTVMLLKHKGFMLGNDNYMTAMLRPGEIPGRVLHIIQKAFTYLVYYTEPFFESRFTLLWSALLVLSVGTTGSLILGSGKPAKKRVLNVALFGVIYVACLLASFLSNFITATDTLNHPRVDFFGIAFFHILILALLFRQNRNSMTNIALVLSVVLIWTSSIQDFNAQKIWKFGFEAEKMQWARIIDRIETTPLFDNDKDYRVVLLGTTEPYRPYFYEGSLGRDSMVVRRAYMQDWNPGQIYALQHYTRHGKKGVWKQVEDKDLPDIAPLIKEELHNADVWPSPLSVQIKDDVIVIVLSKTELDTARALAGKQGFTP
jgi:hypothetical protein